MRGKTGLMAELRRAPSDDLPARVVPHWSADKLYFIERYLQIFCVGMRARWRLVYADLLAGPGLCIDETTGEPMAGSALLALQHPEFARLFLNDLISG
jgi:hypothetical protein